MYTQGQRGKTVGTVPRTQAGRLQDLHSAPLEVPGDRLDPPMLEEEMRKLYTSTDCFDRMIRDIILIESTAAAGSYTLSRRYSDPLPEGAVPLLAATAASATAATASTSSF